MQTPSSARGLIKLLSWLCLATNRHAKYWTKRRGVPRRVGGPPAGNQSRNSVAVFSERTIPLCVSRITPSFPSKPVSRI